ncbi:MAG: terminase small subunit [Pseudomonadota bacterium]
MADKLTPKQQRFVEEYLIDLNATQAATRAGYSEKTANEQGSQLLAKLSISNAIAQAQAERSKRTEVTADMVIKELARIGFSDLRNVLTSEGHLIDPQDWDDDTAAAIASIEVVTTHRSDADKTDEDKRKVDHTHKIKVWDKNSALEKLAKHLGMFVERHELSGPEGGPLHITEIGLVPGHGTS